LELAGSVTFTTMPPISLVVCAHREQALLARLLDHAQGCYDDLVVVHDGPEGESMAAAASPAAGIDFSTLPPGEIPQGYQPILGTPLTGPCAKIVLEAGGRFFHGPKSFQQEPHWPFAWHMAKHDWILKLDADEYPSGPMKEWLLRFRSEDAMRVEASGYTCIWPLWDGSKATTKHWPDGRLFLFNKQRVRFFGMAEHLPEPDSDYTPLSLVLHHEPHRPSYGIRSIVFRKQAYHWRRVIAESLAAGPLTLPRWRHHSNQLPPAWAALKQQPIRQALIRLIRFPIQQLRGMIRAGEKISMSACLNPGLHHFLLGLRVWLELQRSKPQPE
jgi:hypothetical protein